LEVQLWIYEVGPNHNELLSQKECEIQKLFASQTRQNVGEIHKEFGATGKMSTIRSLRALGGVNSKEEECEHKL